MEVGREPRKVCPVVIAVRVSRHDSPQGGELRLAHRGHAGEGQRESKTLSGELFFGVQLWGFVTTRVCAAALCLLASRYYIVFALLR